MSIGSIARIGTHFLKARGRLIRIPMWLALHKDDDPVRPDATLYADGGIELEVVA